MVLSMEPFFGNPSFWGGSIDPLGFKTQLPLLQPQGPTDDSSWSTMGEKGVARRGPGSNCQKRPD